MQAQQQEQAFRLLLKNVEFSDNEAEGWEMLEELVQRLAFWSLPPRPYYKGTVILPLALQLLYDDIQQNPQEDRVASMLWIIYDIGDDSDLGPKEAVDLILNATQMVNARFSHGGFSPMHSALSEELLCYTAISRSLTRGADLHLIGTDFTSGQPETPLSVAMYSAWTFFNCRKSLIRLGFDAVGLREFVRAELRLREYPLVLAGWEEDTLLALFRYDFKTSHFEKYCCERCYSGNLVEPYWMKKLEDIRTRREYVKESGRTVVSHGADKPKAKPPYGFQRAATVQEVEEMEEEEEEEDVERDGFPVKLLCRRCFAFNRAWERGPCWYCAAFGEGKLEDEELKERMVQPLDCHDKICGYCSMSEVTGEKWSNPHKSALSEEQEEASSDDDYSPFLFST